IFNRGFFCIRQKFPSYYQLPNKTLRIYSIKKEKVPHLCVFVALGLTYEEYFYRQINYQNSQFMLKFFEQKTEKCLFY
ncbi:hypothetical protein BpHYR1_045053, partial [Brachionus plicatilis]